MKVFVSSLISGMEEVRQAARAAVSALGYQPIMAEDFGARTHSPQVSCLDGVRQAEVVVLILGGTYGATQPSGVSATHEEYREARGRRPILAFVQSGVSREPEQTAFVNEVQSWESGLFRAGFTDAADLQPAVTRALHQWQLANAAGPLDPAEMSRRTLVLLPTQPRGGYSFGRGESALWVAISGGPTQPILRPKEMEDDRLAKTLMREALFGDHPVFDPGQGSTDEIKGSSLVLAQGEDGAAVTLDELGSILLKLPVHRPERGHSVPVVIEEDVQRQLAAALGYGGWLLEHIDPTQRLTHVVLAVRLDGAGHLAWRTRAEHAASPNQVSMGHRSSNSEGQLPVQLTPPHRPRAALLLDAAHLVEDFVVLLRRHWKS